MLNFVRKTATFLLFLIFFILLVNIVYLLILSLTDWDFRKRIEALTLNDPDYDLLVLGTSLPEYGIDTELLTAKGIKSYNLSLIGNSDETCYVQLNEYLEKYTHKPKYVIYGLDSRSDIYSKGIQPIVEFSMKGYRYTINDLPVSKFRWYGVDILKKVFSRGHRKTRISYGQIKSARSKPDLTTRRNLVFDKSIPESSKWKGEIARVCNNNNIKLIFVTMPEVKEWQTQSDTGPVVLNFRNGYSAISYNFNNQEFCNLLDTEKDWIGLSHLNQYGAEKFTRFLFDHIGL